MSEDDLLTAVLDLCRYVNVRTLHIRPARTALGWRTAVSGDGKGFPDLLIVGSKGVLYRELKTAKGLLTPDQKAWLECLKAAGQNAAIWRTEHLPSGLILREIQAVA